MSSMPRLSAIWLILPLLQAGQLQAAEGPSFEERIAPLLSTHCLKCHSGQSAKGDLDLTTRSGLQTGGTHGPAIVAGKSAESLLFTHVRDRKMPPKSPLAEADTELLRRWIDAGAVWQGPALKAPSGTVARADASFWSLQPIRRPTPPTVQRAEWVRDPIDAFILAGLEKEGIAPAPEADRRTYIRRVTFDLIGLPPTPAEIDAFLQDQRAEAYEKLVDRLLASPRYGERWARHWLDVVRFTESHGYEMNTLRPTAWPYRDYVIQAFNEDRAFPRFIREQLAGDVVGKNDPVTQAATGFLVAGPHDLVGNATAEGKAQQRADDLADMVSVTGSTFLGLTVGCARCHDHKFDPITSKDFYALQAVFSGVEHAERPLAVPDSVERRQEVARLLADLENLRRRLDEAEPLAGGIEAKDVRQAINGARNVDRFAPVTARFVRFTILATLDGAQPCLDELEIYGPGKPELNLALNPAARVTASSELPGYTIHKIDHIRDGQYGNGHSWISNEAGKGHIQIELPEAVLIHRIIWGRDREQKYKDRLASNYRVEVSENGMDWKPVAGSWDRVRPGEKPPAIAEQQVKLLDQSRKLLDRLNALEKALPAYVGVFRTPDPTFLLERGDPLRKGVSIEPGGIAAVGPSLTIKPNAGEAERRLALAEWIGNPANPLPARVMVNRVWQWHFGEGLVRTPGDLGFNGDRPSHPELLDWLAAEFQANGWQLKPLHRRIVLSATYRQSSRATDKAIRLDAGNRLLWRYAPRRLEAEAIRDSILQVSGSLDLHMGGPGYNLWDYSGYVIVFTPRKTLGPDTFRRMIYQFKPRLQQDGAFGAFDCPDGTTTTPRRNRSTTALQALNLLNDPFLLDQSDRFAARVSKEGGDPVEGQVVLAFRLAFGREPAPTEAAAAAKLVLARGLPALCRALFNANEFVFVD